MSQSPPSGGRSRGRGAAVAAVVVLVLAGAALAGFLLLSGRDGTTTSGNENSRPSQPADAEARDARDARAAAKALQKLDSDPAALVAGSAQKFVADRADQAVPPGSTVAADPATWAPDGIGGGTLAVTITAPDRPRVTYAAVMVHEDDGWKVLATFPVADPAASSEPGTGSGDMSGPASDLPADGTS